MRTRMRGLSAVTSVWMPATLVGCGGGNEVGTPRPTAPTGVGATVTASGR